jgi:hypothetical protein
MEEQSKKSFEVKILGQIIRIKHDNDEYVRRLESFLGQRIADAEKQQNITTLQLAARVLLVLADECLTLTKARDEERKTVNDRARRMIEFIDKKTVSK